MTLQEIKAKILSLETTISDYVSGKVKATTELLAQLKLEFSTFQASVVKDLEAAQASVSDLTAKLTKSTEEVGARDSRISTVTAALDKTLTGFALDPKTFTTDSAKVDAIANHVTTTLAAAGVDPKVIPAPAPAATGKDAKALQAEYRALIKSGKSREASEFYAKHADKMLE